MKNPEITIVGKPFTRKKNYPNTEFAVMEWGSDTPEVIIQFPGLTKQELKAFKNSFKKYYFGVYQYKSVLIPYFIFDFPEPFNAIEINFNAIKMQTYSEETKQALIEYFKPVDGGTKNAMMFYLLDNGIVQAIKQVGLHSEAILEFQSVLKQQLKAAYTNQEFAEALSHMYAERTTQQLIQKANKYQF